MISNDIVPRHVGCRVQPVHREDCRSRHLIPKGFPNGSLDVVVVSNILMVPSLSEEAAAIPGPSPLNPDGQTKRRARRHPAHDQRSRARSGVVGDFSAQTRAVAEHDCLSISWSHQRRAPRATGFATSGFPQSNLSEALLGSEKIRSGAGSSTEIPVTRGPDEVKRGDLKLVVKVQAMGIMAPCSGIKVKLVATQPVCFLRRPAQEGRSVTFTASAWQRDEVVDVEKPPPREGVADPEAHGSHNDYLGV